ncbi:DinB family protein [Rapidithrix thailandica]|uniref:DinB family protein n=1 Tax=Rapidithrix thailandica TaxID=413964 RepID=A0AAW9SF37_9BACT
MNIQETIQNLKELHSGNPWHGTAILPILQGVAYDKVNRKTAHQSNSIGQILEHMLSWRSFIQRKLEGDKPFDIQVNSRADWNKDKTYTQEEWQTLIDEFEKSHQTLCKIIASLDKDFLLKTVPGRNYDYTFLLNGLSQHDLYHIGQIALLNSLL